MSPEQAAKLRKGDRILVEMVVSGTNFAPRIPAHLASMSIINAFTVDPTDIYSVLPRPLEAGDRVKLKTSMSRGVVLAVDGHEAWVRWSEGVRNTQDLSDLQRVEDQ